MAIQRVLEKVRILVVEDHDETRYVLAKGLESRGAIVDSVDSVDEALLEVGDFLPDVIVSDLGLPGRDGFELVHTLRERLERDTQVRTPVVAVTGLPDAWIRKRGADVQFEALLQKPYDLRELVGIIAALAPQIPA